jgi:hypothetical protein
MEVAVGGSDGTLYVFGANGSLFWSADITPAGCDSSQISSQPAVAAIHGDGQPHVVVTYGAQLAGQGFDTCDGGVVVYDGAGNVDWSFSLLAWQQSEGFAPENLHGVLSSPALADTEGDGTLEIAFGAFDRNLYLLDHDGAVRWYYHAADTIWSSPVFMNVDEDGPLELVVGSDISVNPDVIPPTTDGGYVQAFNTRARTPKRIDFGTGFVWRTPNLDQAIFSSPAVGDVLASNPGDEIVIGSGCFFPPGTANKEGKWVRILRPSDGAILQTLDVPAGGTCVQSSPALGDIDDDDALEIVVTMGSSMDTGGDGLGRIVAWDPENPTPKWSTVPYSPHEAPMDAAGNDGDGGDIQSPVIADLDGNGSLEVLAANFWSVVVLNGLDGAPLTCQDNTCGSQTSLFAWGTVKSTPVVGDIDGDGDPEVVIGGAHISGPPGRGLLYAWSDFSTISSPAGMQPAFSAPWPSFRNNPMPPGSPTPPEPPEPTDPVDPCASLDLYPRLACELAAFLDTPPCELSTAVRKKLQKAQAVLETVDADTSSKKIKKFRKKALKQIKLANKKARSKKIDANCRATLNTEINALISVAKQLPRSL